MRPTYNPFTKETDVKETAHGVIVPYNYRYFTHRKPEHFFKKFQGFGISKTEIQASLSERCTHVVIKYHGKKENVLYRMDYKYLPFLETYNNNGDEQLIFPISEMEEVGREKLE